MITEKSYVDKLGVMVDCSRNSVLSVDAVKRLIDNLRLMGYNTLQLYTEDTYEVDGEPYFGYMRGRYTKEEIRDIDDYAIKNGIELIPCVQTLAHLKQIFRWQPYWHSADCNDILLTDDDRTYMLIDNIFSSLASCFTSRRVNIGMDEAHFLGFGQYFDKHGYTARSEIMKRHLEKVLKIAEKYGFRCMMWSDMFFRIAFGDYYTDEVKTVSDEVRSLIPDNVDLIYWDYYSTDEKRYDNMMACHKQISKNIMFAGGGWTWSGLAPNNRYGIKVTEAAFSACIKNEIREAFITLWGDDGGSCSPFAALPTLFTAAMAARGKTAADEKDTFYKLFGIPFDTFMSADLPNVLYDNQHIDPSNPSKYLFYNDCLLGVFDSSVTVGSGEIYLRHAAQIKIAEKYGDWKYIFKPLRLLCEVLSLKVDLGLRTRELYEKKDKSAIDRLVKSVYYPLINKAKVFYKEFSDYWNRLYKPHGFDVMDYRIGGLIARLTHVAKKLTEYACGETDSICELDEELLDYLGGVKNFNKKAFSYNGFATTATVNWL